MIEELKILLSDISCLMYRYRVGEWEMLKFDFNQMISKYRDVPQSIEILFQEYEKS